MARVSVKASRDERRAREAGLDVVAALGHQLRQAAFPPPARSLQARASPKTMASAYDRLRVADGSTLVSAHVVVVEGCFACARRDCCEVRGIPADGQEAPLRSRHEFVRVAVEAVPSPTICRSSAAQARLVGGSPCGSSRSPNRNPVVPQCPWATAGIRTRVARAPPVESN